MAAAAGYLTIAVAVFLSLATAYALLGPEFVFREASNMATLPWSLASLLCGFAGALVGGYVAGRLGKTPEGFGMLIWFVMILGLVLAVYAMTDRTAMLSNLDSSEWSFLEASRREVHPIWFYFVLPLLGGLGVLWGGRTGFPESDV